MSVLLEALKKAAENKQQGDETDKNHEEVFEEASASSASALNDGESDLSEAQDQPIGSETESIDESSDKTSYTGLQLLNEEDSSQSSLVGIDELEFTHSPEISETSVDEVILDDEKQTSSAKSELAEETKEDLEPSLSIEESASRNEIIDPNQGFDEQFENTANEPKQSLEADSYSWTMEQLPGYQTGVESAAQYADAADSSINLEQQDNPILTSEKRFKVSAKKSFRSLLFGRSSNFVVYTLSVFLLLSFITFFSVLYFQEQSFKLEKSMQKYEIAESPVVNVPVKETEKNTTVATEKDDAPALIEELQLVSKDSLEPTVSQQEAGSKAKEPALTDTTSKIAYSTRVQSQKAFVQPRIAPQTLSLNVETVPFESEIQVAYQSLYTGEYNKAAQLFNKVLRKDSENVKALTGLGAVYAQMGQESKAIDQYYQVLKVEPENLQAFEAIISLMGNSLSGSEWRKEIQRVLDKHPDSPVLNYALGNLYAQERDWEKAQSYYFESYVLDEENPDSLVNLAVSLDHLGKYQLAEKYYTLALVYADAGSVNFKPDQVKQRLATIKKFIEQEGL